VKIGIYTGASSGSIGGAEFSVAVLAEALGRFHEVDIVHHRPSLSASQLGEFFGMDLRHVNLRYTDSEPIPFGDSRLPWRRYQEAKVRHRTLSEPYDVFINFTHYMPPFCHASVGILMILFPFYDPLNEWPRKEDASHRSSFLWRYVRNSYYDWEWQRRMESYRLKLANSHFTAVWANKRWGVECKVLYPPVDNNFRADGKENSIVSVGRFTDIKKQLEMVSAFRGLNCKELHDWTYYCLGSVGDSPSARNYYEKVSVSAGHSQVRLIADADRVRLRSYYERSKVFWHAAGLGEDDAVRPELSEHFGIATVEAMAAGCVPVVINKGGQQEIVEHGVNGFLWNTLEELVDYTVRLAKDDRLRARMAQTARIHAQRFSREKFVERFQALLGPVLS
jgi:glycosyltransferase involved in cell wall biosynthesis